MAPPVRMTTTTRAVLRAILDADRAHGTAIIRATGLRSGTVYPILDRLESHGLAASAWESEAEWQNSEPGRPRRRYYRLTEEGCMAAAAAPRLTHTWPIAIDPYGCGCTECITGEYVPLERASDAQLAAMLRGEIRDNTNTGELGVVITVRRAWGDFTRELDPALLGITLDTDTRSTQ